MIPRTRTDRRFRAPQLAIAIAAASLLTHPTVPTSADAEELPVVPSLDDAQKAAAVDSIATALEHTYIFLEVAEKMEERMRASLAEGRYRSAATVPEFAGLLTEDLQDVSKDLHLHIDYLSDERWQASQERSELSETEQLEAYRNELAANNFNFKQIEIRPGNVGYLRFDGFVDAAFGGETAVAAMKFLANTDALIIDLRYNGGGSPSMIQLISSYFFQDRTHLNTFYVRADDEHRQFWTNTYVDGPLMLDTEIYVLTSGSTFSAAEEFSYNLRNLERATLVGETTGGGAHPVTTEVFPDLNLSMSLPYGRAINPITNTNWEGTGVAPHIDCPADQALDTAYLDALRVLREKETDESRQFQITWALDGIESTLQPASLGPESMGKFVGRYGARNITLEGGELFYQRGEGRRMRMIPMKGNLFRFDEIDYFRLEVVTNASGAPIKLVGHYSSGRTDESARSTEG